MLPQDSYLNAHQIKKSGSAATPAASGSSLAAVHLRRASVAAKANQPPGLRRFHSWDRTGVQYLVDLPQGTGGYGGEYRDMMWIEFDGIFKKIGEWIDFYGFLMIFDMEIGRIEFWIQIQIRLRGTKHIGMNLKGEAKLETLCIHIAGCCKWNVADRIHATPVGSIVYFQTSSHL